MLLDRLKPYMTAGALSRMVSDAQSSRRRISASIVSPLCHALELAARDRRVPQSQGMIPRRILQFWDQETIPADVRDCMATWRALPGCDYVLFDNERARDFLEAEYEARHLEAYDLCPHPAMKSDLFRLAWLYRHGGVYIDADDSFEGSSLEQLFGDDGLFKLRSASFTRVPSEPAVTIFNNNPIFAMPREFVLHRALERATTILLSLGKRDTYNVLVVTGPANLSMALYVTALDCIARNEEFLFAPIIGWDDIVRKHRNLEYQKTDRNWRDAWS